MVDRVAVNQEIGARADLVWAMVSDLTRMGEWSPENQGATWRGGATGPEVGASFRGVNRNGKKRWSTSGQVVVSEPERLFVFRTTAVGLPIAEWRYEFEVTPGGCRVTETWIDRRGRMAKALGKPASGVADRATHNRGTMEQTLANLKAAAEQS
jgi:Polyketide cyclase / dehydrase and lipid transport